MNKKFDDLAKLEYPGDPVTDPQGKYDVDGLRSRYTCALRSPAASSAATSRHTLLGFRTADPVSTLRCLPESSRRSISPLHPSLVEQLSYSFSYM